jgi:hypothetical protein
MASDGLVQLERGPQGTQRLGLQQLSRSDNLYLLFTEALIHWPAFPQGLKAASILLRLWHVTQRVPRSCPFKTPHYSGVS